MSFCLVMMTDEYFGSSEPQRRPELTSEKTPGDLDRRVVIAYDASGNERYRDVKTGRLISATDAINALA